MKQIRELAVVLHLNMKLFVANKMALVVLVVVSVVFAVLSGGLVKEYEKKTSLPIGVVDYDQSECSKRLVEEVSHTEGFSVIRGTETVLKQKLEEEQVYAYFIIQKGYEQKVKGDKARELVTMCYLKENGFVSILSDIFAKSMMNDVLQYRSASLYERYAKEHELVKKREYLLWKENDPEFSSAGRFFEKIYYQVGEDALSETKEVKNAILANQLFLGITAMFCSFLTMFLVLCLGKKAVTLRRMQMGPMTNTIREVGDLVSLLAAELFLGIAITIYIGVLLGGLPKGAWGQLFAVCLVYLYVQAIFFFLFSKLVKKETTYQCVCVIFLLVAGGFGTMSSMGQITMPLLNRISKNIPNYWFITNIIDIILADKTNIRLFPLFVLSGLALIFTSSTGIKRNVMVR